MKKALSLLFILFSCSSPTDKNLNQDEFNTFYSFISDAISSRNEQIEKENIILSDMENTNKHSISLEHPNKDNVYKYLQTTYSDTATLEQILNEFRNQQTFTRFIIDLGLNIDTSDHETISYIFSQFIENIDDSEKELEENTRNLPTYYFETPPQLITQEFVQSCFYNSLYNIINSIYKHLDPDLDLQSVLLDYKRYYRAYMRIGKTLGKKEISSKNGINFEYEGGNASDYFNENNSEIDTILLCKLFKLIDPYNDVDKEIELIKKKKQRYIGRNIYKVKSFKYLETIKLFSFIDFRYPYIFDTRDISYNYLYKNLSSSNNDMSEERFQEMLSITNKHFKEIYIEQIRKGIDSLKQNLFHAFQLAIRVEGTAIGCISHWIGLLVSLDPEANDLKFTILDSSNIGRGYNLDIEDYHQIRWFASVIQRSLTDNDLSIENEFDYLIMENRVWGKYSNIYQPISTKEILRRSIGRIKILKVNIYKLLRENFEIVDGKYDLPNIDFEEQKEEYYVEDYTNMLLEQLTDSKNRILSKYKYDNSKESVLQCRYELIDTILDINRKIFNCLHLVSQEAPKGNRQQYTPRKYKYSILRRYDNASQFVGNPPKFNKVFKALTISDFAMFANEKHDDYKL